MLRKGEEPCVKLNNAWKKYGEENFEYEILCFCDEGDLNEMEQMYIQKFDSYNNGYNCTLGGDGIVGYRHTDEAKRKIGDAFRGKHLPDDFKKKLSEIQKGKHLTEEHKHALSVAWTPERKTMMTRTRSGCNNPNYRKTGMNACNKMPIISSTGEFFFTLRDAANWCGLKSTGNISSCCRGKEKHVGIHPMTGEKLSWRYATEEEISAHYNNT